MTKSITQQNANDLSAAVYDQVYYRFKDAQLNQAELNLILKLLIENFPKLPQEKIKILDIGCGTGRHLVLLRNYPFHLVGLDTSHEMLKVAAKKLDLVEATITTHYNPLSDRKIQLLENELTEAKLPRAEFQLICLFWNAFNEIALTEEQALKFLTFTQKILAPHGCILLNCDDVDDLDPQDFNFNYHGPLNETTSFELNWQVKTFHPQTNTTISEERIIITDSAGKLLQTLTSQIEQRWWRLKEIHKLAEQAGFALTPFPFGENEELYLLLKRL